MKIDRATFFQEYRKRAGALKQPQVDGLESLLASIESDARLWSEAPTLAIGIDWAAYMLATTKHETAHTFKPVHEYGSRNYFIARYGGQTPLGRRLGNDTPEEGAIYAGDGDVQLTGESNYERAERELREQYPEIVAEFERRTGRAFDLTAGDQPDDEADPQNAGDPVIAYCIMSAGMRQGWFTSFKLSNFFNTSKQDPVKARQIINGLDRANLIARYWSDVVTALRSSVIA